MFEVLSLTSLACLIKHKPNCLKLFFFFFGYSSTLYITQSSIIVQYTQKYKVPFSFTITMSTKTQQFSFSFFLLVFPFFFKELFFPFYPLFCYPSSHFIFLLLSLLFLHVVDQWPPLQTIDSLSFSHHIMFPIVFLFPSSQRRDLFLALSSPPKNQNSLLSRPTEILKQGTAILKALGQQWLPQK